MSPAFDIAVWEPTSSGLYRRGRGTSFTLGVTQPNASNTGYGVLGYTASTLVDVVGDVTLTSGQTLQGKRVHGAVFLNGSNIVVQGNEIVGRVPTSYNANFRGLITCSGGTNNVVQYNHITQYDPSTNTDNSVFYREGAYLTGGGVTLYRNDIHDVNHIVYVTGGTHIIRGNYLHDPGLRTDDADHSTDPRYPNWSHNDGTHLAGGSNHIIEGNNYVMKFSLLTGMNSAANPSPTAEQIYPNCHGHLFRQANSTLSAVQVKNNWYAYGAVAMQWTDSTLNGGGADWTVSGNRVTPNQAKEYSYYQQLVIDTNANWPSLVGRVDSTNVYSQDSDTPALWRGVTLKAPTGSTGRSWAFNLTAHTP